MMKYIASGSLTFAVGLVLGGFHPRMELQKAQNEPSVINIEKKCQSTVGSDLAKLMSQGGSSSASNPHHLSSSKDPEEIIKNNPKAVEVASQIDQEQERFEEELSKELENIPNEELEAARGALELRRAQARAALIEDANPDQDQLDQIDQAIQDMNDSLLQIADELADTIQTEGEPNRRDAMSFAADALDTMLNAEETMRNTLNTDQITNLDDRSLDPFSYVSPELVDVLQSFDQP